MADIGFVWVAWPYARIRRELSVSRGAVTRFVFQLEYDVRATPDGRSPHDWRAVARFDHDVDGSHDVAEEGLHLDVYRNGEKVETFRGFPEVPLNEAPDFCQRFLVVNSDDLLDQFERWHDVGEEWR